MADREGDLPELFGCRRIHDLLAFHVCSKGDGIAAVDGDMRLDYRELSTRVDAVAKGLVAAGVEPGDRVATMAPPSLDFWLTYLATVSIGAVWMGLNPRYTVPEYAYLLGDAEPRIVFVRSPFEDRDYAGDLAAAAAGRVRLVGLGDALEELVDGGTAVDDARLAARRAAVDPEDIAVIVYTSGTTGQPKGAMLSHRAIMAAALTNLRWMGGGLASTICAAPINHVGALNNVCMNVFAYGGRIVFFPRVDLAAITELARVERPTYLVGSPTSFAMFAADPTLGLERFGTYELLVFGGGVTAEVLLAPVAATGVAMSNVYGQTETCGIVTATAFGASTTVMAETIGAPLADAEIRIARADGSIAGVDESGEIQVRGPYCMSGYFRREDATRAVFTDDGYLRTGDLGTRRADGNFTFVGRLREMYKSGGYNIYPVEIELALAAHPMVAVAAVLPVAHDVFQEVGHAFVECVPGAELDATALRDWLRVRLANYKVPKTFSFETLPLLPNYKIDKQALKRRLIERLAA